MAKDKKEKGFGKKWKKDQERMGIFSPIPADDYKMVIKSAEIGPTKAKDGKVCKITYEVLKGEYKGRTFSEWLTYDHPNPKTVEIADKHIASLCDAIGLELTALSTPEQLVKGKLTAKVGVTPGDDKYGPGNVINRFYDAGEEPNTDDKTEEKKDKKKDKNKPWEDDDDDKTEGKKKDKKKKKKKDKSE